MGPQALAGKPRHGPLASSSPGGLGVGGPLGHNQRHWDGGPLPSELSGVMRRHRCYSQLLTICLAVMVTFALPKGLNWIGLVTRKPVTEDYVPLLPWFGIVLAGMFAGKKIAQVKQSVAAWQWSPAGPAGRSLAWAGRHSLTIYMVHQPLLMGLLFALVRRG